jgi:hypothetical protein
MARFFAPCCRKGEGKKYIIFNPLNGNLNVMGESKDATCAGKESYN